MWYVVFGFVCFFAGVVFTGAAAAFLHSNVPTYRGFK